MIYKGGIFIPISVSVIKGFGACCYVFESSVGRDFFETIYGVDNHIGLSLLFVGILTLCLLFLIARSSLGEMSNNHLVMYYKDHIQTYGYLLTLIGFLNAILGLMQLDSGSAETTISLNTIAFPIALAIVTSILGWGLGNELIKFLNRNDQLEHSINKLQKNISSLADEVLIIKSKYQTSSNKFISTFNDLAADQTDILKQFNESKGQLKVLNRELVVLNKDTISNISSELDQLTAFYKQKIGTLLNETNESLADIAPAVEKAIQVLISKFSEELKRNSDNGIAMMEDLRGLVASSTNSFSNSVNQNNKNLIDSIKSIEGSFYQSNQKISDFHKEIKDSYQGISGSIGKDSRKVQTTLDNLTESILQSLSKYNIQVENHRATLEMIKRDIEKGRDEK